MSVYVIHQYGDTALVAVLGEMDAFNYRLLESELESLMLEGARHILVDAGELLFCDVSGARALERVHQSLRSTGGELFIVPSPSIVRLLTVLWGAQEPGQPGLVTAFSLGDLSGVLSLSPRHVPTVRRVGTGRRARRGPGVQVPAVLPETPDTRAGSAVPPAAAPPEGHGPESPAPAGPVSPVVPVVPVAGDDVAPARSAPALSGEVARTGRVSGTTRSAYADHVPHPALERSARLRREAAARLETLHHRTRTTCARLAEMHDRLHTLQARLDTHVAVRAAVRLACDDLTPLG
ncbi:STAS domain-containing protein [Streptosporangium longisporum]